MITLDIYAMYTLYYCIIVYRCLISSSAYFLYLSLIHPHSVWWACNMLLNSGCLSGILSSPSGSSLGLPLSWASVYWTHGILFVVLLSHFSGVHFPGASWGRVHEVYQRVVFHCLYFLWTLFFLSLGFVLCIFTERVSSCISWSLTSCISWSSAGCPGGLLNGQRPGRLGEGFTECQGAQLGFSLS